LRNLLGISASELSSYLGTNFSGQLIEWDTSSAKKTEESLKELTGTLDSLYEVKDVEVKVTDNIPSNL